MKTHQCTHVLAILHLYFLFRFIPTHGFKRYTFDFLNRLIFNPSVPQRLYEVDGNLEDYLQYQPQRYAYEGQGSKCQSLDGMSLSNLGDDLTFLNDLDPKFNSLAGICRSTLQGRNTQLWKVLLNCSFRWTKEFCYTAWKLVNEQMQKEESLLVDMDCA